MSRSLPEMPCIEFVEQVTNYLEGALVGDDLVRLETHLAVCSHCAHYLDQLRLIRDRAGQLAPADITPPMRADLMQAFARWRQDG